MARAPPTGHESDLYELAKVGPASVSAAPRQEQAGGTALSHCVTLGPIGIAWAFAAANLLTLIPSFLVAIRGTPLRLGDVWAAMWRPLMISVAVFGGGHLAHIGLASQPVLVRLSAGLVASAAVVAAALLLSNTVRSDVATLRELCRPSL